MELKGMMDKIGPPGGPDFIGKKCQKFIEYRYRIANTVSIVPIIGQIIHPPNPFHYLHTEKTNFIIF